MSWLGRERRAFRGDCRRAAERRHRDPHPVRPGRLVGREGPPLRGRLDPRHASPRQVASGAATIRTSNSVHPGVALGIVTAGDRVAVTLEPEGPQFDDLPSGFAGCARRRSSGPTGLRVACDLLSKRLRSEHRRRQTRLTPGRAASGRRWRRFGPSTTRTDAASAPVDGGDRAPVASSADRGRWATPQPPRVPRRDVYAGTLSPGAPLTSASRRPPRPPGWKPHRVPRAPLLTSTGAIDGREPTTTAPLRPGLYGGSGTSM